MSAPYRGDASFEVAIGTRAVTELRAASRPGIPGWESLFVMGAIALAGTIGTGRWHGTTSLVAPLALVVMGWVGVSATRRFALAQMAQGHRTRGALDASGVALESDDGGSARWSWNQFTHATRTKTALVLFATTGWGVVILAESHPNLDRLTEIATTHARTPWRAPSRWMVVVLVAQLVLTGVAMWPRSIPTPLARIDDALDRGAPIPGEDFDALAWGTLCDQAALADVLEARHAFALAPWSWDDERAAILAARDIGRCAPGELTPHGRVIIEDEGVGPCTYYVFTLRGDGWVLVGPYAAAGDEARAHAERGTFEIDAAFDAANRMQERVLGRSGAAHFDSEMRPREDDEER